MTPIEQIVFLVGTTILLIATIIKGIMLYKETKRELNKENKNNK